MNRYLLIIILILSALVLKAQPMNVIEASEGEAWWGYAYYNGSGSYRTVGTNLKETCDVAMFIPGTNATVVGNEIKAIRIYFDKKDGLQNVKVWLSTSLPSSADNANVMCKAVDAADIVTLSDDGQPIDVALNEPYQVTSQGVYVGYSFTSSQEGNLMPIVVGTQGEINNSFFLHSSQSFTSWDDMNLMGPTLIQVLVAGTVKYDAVSIADIGEINVAVNKPAEVRLKLKNEGANVVSKLAYNVWIDDNPPYDELQEVDFEMRSSDEERVLTIPLGQFNEVGQHNFRIKIAEVNGNRNNVSGEVSGLLNVVDQLAEWPRKVLVEEFTTEPCPNCPIAATRLKQVFADYPELNDQAIVVCHHSAYGTDWLTVDASRDYTWFFGGTGTTYAPAFMYDRYHFADNDDPKYGGGPAERVKSVDGLKQRIDNRLDIPSNVNIELSAAFDSDKKNIEVDANCQRGKQFGDKLERITVYVTEDDITARHQQGATGEYIHQHVLRAVNSAWGVNLDWNDNKATYTCRFPVDEEWETDKLHVVAFVSNYDSSNCNNCVVEQTEFVTLTDDVSAIEEKSHATEIKAAGYYSLDGRQLNTTKQGINIVRMSDGTVKKIFIR